MVKVKDRLSSPRENIAASSGERKISACKTPCAVTPVRATAVCQPGTVCHARYGRIRTPDIRLDCFSTRARHNGGSERRDGRRGK